MVFQFVPRETSIGDTLYAPHEENARKRTFNDDQEDQVAGINKLKKLAENHKAAHENLINAIEKLARVSTHVSRGQDKVVCFPDQDSKYVSVGQYPFCGKKEGVRTWNAQKKAPQETTTLIRFVRFCKWRMIEWLPRPAVLGIEKAKKALGHTGMRNVDGFHPSGIFGSLAFGESFFFSCHQDEDSLYSIVTVQGPGSKEYYRLDDDIVFYFCFPTYGVCVALRPGDILIFNPCVPHCVSSGCHPEKPHYTMSLYLKTAVVGGNDNSKDLTEEQAQLLQDLSSE